MPIVILALIAVGYAALVVAWRWLLRRWRLAGPGAPPRTALGRQEYLARRSLRALLAFDFLVIIPASLPTVVAVAMVGREALPVLFSLAVFVAPVPFLCRSVARLEQRRLQGLPEETAHESRARARSTGHPALDAQLAGRARGTYVVALVIVLISLAAWLDPGNRLLMLLAKDNGAIGRGELWRLITVALVHAGVVHLFFNVGILLDVGATVERLAGAARMLLVLVVGTVAGSVLSVAFMPRPSVGASGGVLALAASLLSLGLRHRALLPSGARRKLVRTAGELVGLNLALTFVIPNVDWAAHLGGIAAGSLLGWFCDLSPAARSAIALAPSSGPASMAAPTAE